MVLALVSAGGARLGSAAERGKPWHRHTIDDSSRGADGVRLADVNGDGLRDIVTGWEEGGVVRVYLNPGHANAKARWPAVTVGKVGSPEDAFFVDLDGDGAVDVVSCCEGRVKSLFVHWAPKDKGRYLDPRAWATEPFPVARGTHWWMFGFPMQIDGRDGTDLVVGAKSRGALIGWLQAPANPRDAGAWTLHPLCKAGWIMSLIPTDMDDDGDPDVLATDRRGKGRGVLWLENPGPGPAQSQPWQRHDVGGNDREVMFMTLADVDQDGLLDILAATRRRELILFRRTRRAPLEWERIVIPVPAWAAVGKAVAVGDIDLDGTVDLVVTCGNARGRSGVLWLRRRDGTNLRLWESRDISGPQGIKYDLAELIDLDGDGDLDVLTCEERTNLGVVWYENPTR